jgi:hypothetical protein
MKMHEEGEFKEYGRPSALHREREVKFIHFECEQYNI